jgi:RES domain-containing protein
LEAEGMIVWRLVPRRHARSLDGPGNRDRGARWNSGGGRGVVKLPANLMLVEIQVPDDTPVRRVEPREIPGNADMPGADRRTWYQRTGDAWLERAETLVLIAPSLVVPKEWNAMLNPAHPRMADVTIVACEPFRFDSRLATDSPAADP